jgi:hypothetical protein
VTLKQVTLISVKFKLCTCFVKSSGLAEDDLHKFLILCMCHCCKDCFLLCGAYQYSLQDNNSSKGLLQCQKAETSEEERANYSVVI